ncbi:MAG: hypothetical protein P4L16_08435 [Chlamydiales bacterium]|nr:hypothetical protein [Chlamydiales bacterium]
MKESFAKQFWKEHEQYALLPFMNFFSCDKNEKREDIFLSECVDGMLKVTGNGKLGAFYGSSQMAKALLAGHLAENLGEHTPRFSLRPLWTSSVKSYQLTPLFFLGISRFIDCEEELLSFFCKRTIELGFNAVVIGSLEGAVENIVPCLMEAVVNICKEIKSYGLKVVIALSVKKEQGICPLDPLFVKLLQENMCLLELLLKEVDYLFWDSLHLREGFEIHVNGADHTHYELIVEELKLLETFKIPLIYFLSTSKFYLGMISSWIQRLLDEASFNTIIAFSAESYISVLEKEQLHPLFYELRKSPDCSSTKLLPLANIGCIQKGEGLWPVLGINFLEKVIVHMYRHPFAGLIALTNDVPLRTSLLDCSLWMAAECLWYDRAPCLFLETWLKAFRPNWHTSLAEEAIREAENILKRVNNLSDYKREFSQERLRFYVEALAASLYLFKELSLRVDLDAEHPLLFQVYASAFLVDVKRLILSNVGSVSSPHFMIQGDQDSFWTSPAEHALLRRPNPCKQDSHLIPIYEASFLKNNG